MASVTSEVTVDTNEWLYPDVFGITHAVTNGQTFNLTIENTASNIKWQVLVGQKLTTTDGYTLHIRPFADGANSAHQIMIMALADSTTSYVLAGELRISCPVTGILQIWKPAKFRTSNVDMNAAGTIGPTGYATIWEDQFGNVMTLPATGAGLTVGQAA